MFKKVIFLSLFLSNLIVALYIVWPNEENIPYENVQTIYNDVITERNSVHLIGVVEKDNIDKVIEKIQQNDIKYLLITSPGGSVDDGMRLINIIEQRRDIICIADEAMSISFILLQACSTRVTTKNPILMHHYAYIAKFAKDLYANTSQLLQMQKEIDDFNNHIEQFMVRRLKISILQYRENLKQDWFITTEDIYQYDIIDKVYNQKISTKY